MVLDAEHCGLSCRGTQLSEFSFGIAHTTFSQSKVPTLSPVPQLQFFFSRNSRPPLNSRYPRIWLLSVISAFCQRSKIMLVSTAEPSKCPSSHVYQEPGLRSAALLPPISSGHHGLSETGQGIDSPSRIIHQLFRTEDLHTFVRCCRLSPGSLSLCSTANSAWKLTEPKLCMFLVKDLAGHDL